jgi:hypothetical protein
LTLFRVGREEQGKKLIRLGRLYAESQPKMSSTRVRPTTVHNSFTRNFATFAPTAWENYQNGMELKDWARAETRRYYHEVEKTTSFPTTYYSLITFADAMLSQQEEGQVRGRSRSRTVQTAPRALERDQALAANFTADGQQTAAEQRMARGQLNRTLFREYSRWWDAFVAEAAEDTERGAPSASDRFSWHCAKMISRQTGIRSELVAPVVAAWVLEHAE